MVVIFLTELSNDCVLRLLDMIIRLLFVNSSADSE
jgi:hypothetical protein